MKIYKKIPLPFVITAALLLMQAACNPPSPKSGKQALQAEQKEQAQTPAKRQTLRINIASEPRSLDPAKASDLQSVTLVRMLFDGLTSVNKDNVVELALADNVIISEDQKTYVFTLRDANWTNGDPLRASDFLYAWQRVVDPNVPADNAFHLYCVKNAKAIKSGEMSLEELGVKAIDDKTLQVELENPTPYFLELVSYPIFCPVNENVDRNVPNWADSVETFVSNGPFSLIEWKHQDSLTLHKNEKYWDEKAVHLDEIALYMLKEETELSMFENNEIDWAGSPLSILPIDALGKLREEKLLNQQPILGTYFLRINTENPLLKSQSIRQALSLSINRNDLVEHALAATQVAASGFVPEVLGLREQSYFHGDESHEAMKSFEKGLEEMSLTSSKAPELELLLVNNERNLRIGQLLQERWQTVLGVKVHLQAIEAKSYFERLYKGDFQIAAGSWIADFNDPISFLEIFKTKATRANQTRWENEEYSKLVEASNAETDSVVRKQMLVQCEKILLEEMPVIPLFHYNLLFVKNKQLNDVAISHLGVIDFKRAKWDAAEHTDEQVE